jgi:UDP-N-acetylmuramate--alanine ligase
MHIYFSGIGGSVINSLAMIAKQAGHEVSGSDMSDSSYIDYIRRHGVTDVHIGQAKEQIAQIHARKPIDWFVYSAALPMTDPNHPELAFCQEQDIRASKRDEFLNMIIKDNNLKLIAVAGTHGKSTTTAMVIWLFKQLGLPLSYSVGAKISFGETGEFQKDSRYFVLEADEFDRNFLNFYPQLSLISGIDWDHPDIYPTREGYYAAFQEYIDQSEHTMMWHDDAEKLALEAGPEITILDEKDSAIDSQVKLAGHVNRLNTWLVARGLSSSLSKQPGELIEILNDFPGLSRRFEQVRPNLYSDYAHTPPKIRGALQLAHEVASDKFVVVYEGLHNTRQHFIKDELANLFDDVKQLYIVPSYLAREDKNLELLTPEKLLDLLSNSSKEHGQAAELNDQLKQAIQNHIDKGDLVLALSAGGAGSLDEWLRREFSA